MIENILSQSVEKKGHEVSFVLGHKILAKTAADWFELKGEDLTINEWEDLKDLCLQSTEKVQLETKGFVSGVYQSKEFFWKFSFIEKKDCYKAYLSLVLESEQVTAGIENPYFWDSIKKEKGIYLVAGEKRQGKSALLSEIINNDYKNHLVLTGVHSLSNQQKWPVLDTLVHLGAESVEWDLNHPIYDGLQRIVLDFNQVRNWAKWIEFAEQGQSVFISISSDSVHSILQKLGSDLNQQILGRLLNAMNGIIVQKFIGEQKVPAQELLIMRPSERKKLVDHFVEHNSFFNLTLNDLGSEAFQSMNQSIIQKLVRRKIDVKSAFAASLDPEGLDAQLKKLGL